MSDDDTSGEPQPDGGSVADPSANGGGSGMDPAKRGRMHVQSLASATGSAPPDISDEQAAAIPEMIGNRLEGNVSRGGGPSNGSMSGSLRELFSGQKAGEQYDGRRHVWDVLGYPESGQVSPESYYQRAERQSPAHIIATTIPQTTWKRPPRVIDDVHDSPDEDQTQFEKDVQSLIDADTRTSLRRGINHYFEWADRAQRPGHFGILFHGLDDGNTKDQPVDINALDSPDDLVYLRPYRETEVTGWTVNGDINDPSDWGTIRPDQPALYEVLRGVDPVPGLEVGADATGTVSGIEKTPTTSGGVSDDATAPIHHSRVVHVAETPTLSEWIGQPCLEPILNRLIDHEKTVGASAEMFWSGADRKYFVTTSSGADGSDVDDELVQWIDEQFTAMNHNMRQAMYTRYMDLEVIDGQEADPSPVVDSLYDEFAGSSGIPKRMMRGSERGDLASSMDEANFFGMIGERQTEFAEPVIFRPSVDRWVETGIVAEPEGGSYTVEWPSLFELTDKEKAEIKGSLAQAYSRAEDAISLGADREAIYEDLGLAHPAPDEGGAGSSSQPPEGDADVQDQFNTALGMGNYRQTE